MAHESLKSEPTADAGQVQGHGEVSRLLAVIARQMADADRRHAEALEDMKSRLQQLGADARVARPAVPNDFACAFSRIEDALQHLAGRISDTGASGAETPVEQAQPGLAATAAALQSSISETFKVHTSYSQNTGNHGDSSAAPAALKSSAAPAVVPAFDWASDFARSRAEGVGADPFDVVDNGGWSKSNEIWSASDAEALTRVYENVAAEPQPVAAAALRAPVSTGAPSASIAYDRQWLEDRFTGLSERLQASLAAAPIHDMLTQLDDRLEQLEDHLGMSLMEVAKRSDVEGLKLVEAHIEEIARHLEEAQGQLGRLDNIETQLNEVVEHLAAQFETNPAVSSATPAEEFQRMADIAAQSVAAQFAGSMPAASPTASSAGHTDQIQNVRELLESYIGERRDGDEHNALMLDTLQQALIRVLDRIDAMEQAQISAAFKPSGAPFGNKGAASVERQRDAEPGFNGPDKRQAFQFENQAAPQPSPFVSGSPLAAPAGLHDSPAAEAAPAPAPDDRSSVDKLRQDFIADAQRAKLRAKAAQAEVSPLTVPRTLEASEIRSRGPAPVPAGAKDGKSLTSSLSPKLIVAALALTAILGAASLWRMGSSHPMAEAGADQAITQSMTTETTPASGEASKAPEATAKTADTPATMAPSASANGFVVDDDTAAQPSKISADELSNPPPGVRLRQSTEPVSPLNLAILQRQQTMANLSNELGETAANTPALASFMREVPITAIPAVTSASTAANTPATATPAASAATPETRAGALDMPPITVGPLSLRLAAAKGDASAEFEAGSRLAEGKGTSQNFKEALRWYQRSAAQGFAQAQYRLGTLYERGLGIKSDTGQARSWYQRAAEQGNVKAMHNLAVLSASRQSGSPDYTTAAKWFRSAADRDLQDSQYNLGVLFENGLGVDKDAKQALKWYSLAARKGDAESTRHRDQIKSQLSQADQADVNQTVAGFQPVKVDNPLINDARAAGEDWKIRAEAQEPG